MRPVSSGAPGARRGAVLPGEARAGACAISAGLRDVRSEHAVPGLAGFSSRRAMPVLPDAHLLDARSPGPVRGRSRRRGEKRRDARAPGDPRPNAVFRCPRSHLSPRAIGGRRLCRAGFADLRRRWSCQVSGVCPLRGLMGARRLWRTREGTGPNCSGLKSDHGALQHILLALQADAQLAIGKPEAALASVAAGLKAVEKMGGAPLEAEFWRLRGEALLARAGTVSEAETGIEKALAVARLRRQQGRGEEAVALLAPTLGWFEEGFDTADLQAARTLLDDLENSA